MCGICGFVGIREDGLLARMTTALEHRGPDGSGFFETDDVGLGHRRLSIIDLEGGKQPIENEDGSLVLIFNGEIYNYQELRKGLVERGHQFKTRSDTEVILHLYEELGPGCLQQLAGMFTIGIWDKRERQLFLARDRLGIKPLYYLHAGPRFLFASEFKSILQYRGFDPSLNPAAVHEYLALRYVPGPGGMFRELRKLPAAHYAIVRDGQVRLERYWTPEIYSGPFAGTESEYLEGYAERFERSVKRRMIAEVPVGAYLSGGLDSSTIVAVMAKLTSMPVRTFTVGFDYEHDELSQAAETARLLGCEHTPISCRISDIELLPKLVYHLDEPLGDPIVIPMYQLAREAKKEVTVILAGEGADETMGGYLFHKALLWGRMMATRTPRFVRNGVIAPALAATPASLMNLAFHYPAALGERGKRKVLDFLGLLEREQLSDAYVHLISLFDSRDTAMLYSDDFRRSVNGAVPGGAQPEIVASSAPELNRILHLQFAHWLPEDILMKQDKMSMAGGIEARVPFLDHELVEYALKIPPALKIRGGVTKYLLRRYAARVLPEPVVKRRKMPFYVPLEKYFADPVFRDMAEDTLSEKTVRNRGFFRPEAVAQLRQAMSRQEFVFVKQAFSLVMLELWCRMALDRRGAA
jgi:asparagine synthase (glutamine-hydrolysing)